MKTAMKRLLSFVLVAMMLVSVVPFQASAADGENVANFRVYTGTTGDYEEKSWGPLGEAFAYSDIVGQYGNFGYDGTIIEVGYMSRNGWVILTSESGVVEFNDVADTGDDAFVMYVRHNPAPVEPVVPKITYQVQIDGVAKYTSTAAEATKVTQAAVDAAIVEAMKTVAAGSKYYDDDVKVEPAVDTAVTADTTVVIKIDEVYQEYTVEFYDDIDAADPIKTLTTRKHMLDKSKVPGDPDKDDYNFLRWDTAKEGFELDFDNLANPLKENYKFYARFEKTDEDEADKFSDIEIIAKRYADGREKQEKILYTIEDVKDGANVYDVLRSYQKTINDEINDLPWDGEWVDNTFYMNSKGSEELDKDMELDGDCTVYVMVGEGDPIKVQLYVHTSYKKEPTYIVNMFGYESDDILKKADINETLEKKWPDRTYKWTGMYSDKDWTDILGDKEGVTAKSSYYLEKYIDPDEDQTVNVHIYATRTYVNNSDNPKTGDTILMAVTAMGLSAAALAAVYFVFKKKQSV